MWSRRIQTEHTRKAGYIAAWQQIRKQERARQLGWVKLTRWERIGRWLTTRYAVLKRTLTTI